MKSFNGGAPAVLSLFLLSVSCFSPVYSAPVSAADVQQVFESWMSRSPHFKGKEAPFVRKSYIVKNLEKRRLGAASMPFYAVELEPEGFAIMNSDTRLAPVLAYSDAGSLNLDDVPENAFRVLLKISMDRSYRKLLNLSLLVSSLDLLQAVSDETANEADWELLNTDLFPVATGMGSVTNGPFLTTTWNQTRHYNKLCPETTNASYGYDGRVPAGCVAIAAAQILNYYKWPYRGTGSHGYTDTDGSVTGPHSVDFSDAYDWDNMLDEYRYWTTEPEAAVAAVSELIYEVGVSVDMDYESGGSAAYTSDLNTMLPQAFFYDKGTYLYAYGNPEAVSDRIRADMLASRPAALTISGHAIIADGHVDDGVDEFFHINYGWGEVNDGWYLVDAIPATSSGTTPAIGCISGLYPAMIPVNVTESGLTNATADVSLEWAIADVRTAEVQSVSVLSLADGSSDNWETVQVSSSLTGTVVSNLADGVHTFALQAYDGASYGDCSPAFTVVVNTFDPDLDGLPSAWELLYFGGATNANPVAMASNGVNTVLEAYIAGLDPTNPASFFKAALTNANGFVVQWNAISGRVYSVFGAANIQSGFQPLETNILWPQSSWTDTVNRSENFYKVDVELE